MEGFSTGLPHSDMDLRLTLLAVFGSLLLLVGIFELVRRKRLKEKYSLLWLLTAAVLVALAASKDLRHAVSYAMGINYPPSAFFLLAFLFLMLIMIQFSVVISNLSAKNRILAQEVALLKLRIEELSKGAGQPGGPEEG